jgi:DNA helicase-2/ATP-dependent DNA helicase PcrA
MSQTSVIASSMNNILEGLNESQKKAVTTTGGPLLIVAGPGTGKTLTIVRRIAWLIHGGVRPEDLLAVTFTNRAAREMRERTEALLGDAAERVFIGTLHLLGLRMMQEALGPGFTVYSREEQIGLLKSLLSCSAKKARQAAESISRIKNCLEEADEETLAISRSYHTALKQQNAVDFEDLILTPIELLTNNPRACKSTFTHIMADEYQDIDPAQYALLKLLAQSGANLCAIGDSDQAIYGFRGADAGTFLRFGDDFKNAATVTLTQNYRSTGAVLSASNAVIRNNRLRIEKEVASTREQGCPVGVTSVPDERAEGDWIVREIESRIGGTSHHQMRSAVASRSASGADFSFSDFAVIFRTNAQAKAIEESFIESGIPYQVIGRKSSLQSVALEETVAFLRSLANPDDAAAGPADDNEAKLLAPADFFDPRANAVTLTTMHTAKGLEFRVVFIAGCEDGLIPLTLMKDGVDIEEERRLFYVGMTRAKDELFLLHGRSRFLYGQRLTPSPSPFIDEIPGELMDRRVMPDRAIKQKEPDRQMGLF